MKLLLYVAIIVVLYVVVRRMSSRGQHSDPYRPPEPVSPVTINAEDIETDVPAAQYRITRYRFANIDADHGPPDPNQFYDELWVDLENVRSGERFSNSIFVCTPDGIAQEMRDKNRETMVAAEMVVVRKYDLSTILEGAKARLEELYDSKFE